MSVPSKLMAVYIQSAPKKLARLETLWATYMENNSGSCQELIEFSHKLAGSGGSYGFTDLGSAARTLELELKGRDNGDRSPPSEDLLILYEQLRHELRQLAHAPVID